MSHNDGQFIMVIDKIIDPHDMLDDKVEAFEYDNIQNVIFNSVTENKGRQKYVVEIFRYVLLFLIGLLTGLVGSFIDFSIDNITKYKFKLISYFLEMAYESYHYLYPILIWALMNAAFVFLSAFLVVFFSPVAAGSGIPQIKCYLNGINVPRVTRLVSMLVKGFGVILSVAGGLAVGKEGPMIHIGAVIAAGLSQGHLYRKVSAATTRMFRYFRNDMEKRDFVSAGAAAGVAAAFGAPVGGLLFAIEEGCSFVNPIITWRILFSSMTSMFTLAFYKSFKNGNNFIFTSGGLISFGSLDELSRYSTFEILIFILMGILGGVLGAIYIHLNILLTKFRKKYIRYKSSKIIEAMIVAILTPTIGYALVFLIQDCKEVKQTNSENYEKIMCADNEFNSLSNLIFNTPEKAVHSLLHDPLDTYSPHALGIFIPIYFLISVVTYGLNVPAGLFLPSLLIGACWGRLFGLFFNWVNPELFHDTKSFALIGAAAQLGGMVRMTVSLTVILMEATRSVILGLPILLTLVIAKNVGDYFNESIYEEHTNLSGMALLPWEPDNLSVTKTAFDVMCNSVICLKSVMRIDEIVERLTNLSSSKKIHHGFPVVEVDDDQEEENKKKGRYGTLVGLIRAEHLSLLLQKKIFIETDGSQPQQLNIYDYDNAYPHFPNLIESLVNLTEQDYQKSIDLRPYMNEAPYCVNQKMTMTRIFRLFRSLGLRHLPVVDHENQVCGIITRKDLRRFRFDTKGSMVRVEELPFSREM